MPTPILFQDERLNFRPALPETLQSTSLPVFYATTPAPASGREAGHSVDAQGEGMTLGVAGVRLGGPDWTWPQFVASDATNTVAEARPGAVEKVEEFGTLREPGSSDAERRFFALNARLARGAA